MVDASANSNADASSILTMHADASNPRGASNAERMHAQCREAASHAVLGKSATATELLGFFPGIASVGTPLHASYTNMAMPGVPQGTFPVYADLALGFDGMHAPNAYHTMPVCDGDMGPCVRSTRASAAASPCSSPRGPPEMGAGVELLNMVNVNTCPQAFEAYTGLENLLNLEEPSTNTDLMFEGFEHW